MAGVSATQTGKVQEQLMPEASKKIKAAAREEISS
jgi:hypothetical protein